MAVMIYMKIDQIMLGQMVGDEAVGIYSAALRISEVWYFIPMMIGASVFPALLEAKQNSEVVFYSRLQALFDLMSVISFAVAAAMTFASPYIIKALFGVDYFESSTVLVIHIWSALPVFIGVASSKWFIAENLQRLVLFRTISNCLINIVLNYFLIPVYGAVGAAIATLITQSAGTFFYDIFRKDTRRLFYMKMSSFNFYRIIRHRSLSKI
jgi:PST family polysaccharide transporter